jgi:cytochrome c5
VRNMIKGSKAGILALVLLGASLTALAVSDKQRAAIEERTKPVGSVCVEGDSSCADAVASGSGGGSKSGEEIYNTSCMACHSTGAAGAPKVGDVAGWSPRIAKGIDQLYANAIGGINGMPAKGLCMACSDDELKATVDYMLEKSK